MLVGVVADHELCPDTVSPVTNLTHLLLTSSVPRTRSGCQPPIRFPHEMTLGLGLRNNQSEDCNHESDDAPISITRDFSVERSVSLAGLISLTRKLDLTRSQYPPNTTELRLRGGRSMPRFADRSTEKSLRVLNQSVDNALRRFGASIRALSANPENVHVGAARD